MGIGVKKNTAVGVEIEVTEGTYVAPSAATSFVQTQADGFEITSSKELLERNIFTSSIGKTSPRVGQTQAAGTIPVEARAFSTEGTAPEYDALMQSALGSKRTIATTTTTKASGNTASVLQLDNADKDKFNIGDIIMVKMDDAYHVSPVSAVDRTTDAATVTLKIPHPSGDMDDSVVIAKSTTYIVADDDHPSLSISKYIEGTILEKVTGAKVTSLALEGFSTGKLPSFKFGFEGLNFESSVTSIPYTPSYDSALPPIVLDARLYMDTTSIDVNDVSFSLENALGFQSSIAAENGRVSSRATERTITGSINPYKQDDSVANYTKYQANTAFSLFAYAKVPTSTDGEFGNVVAVYMPNCIITELNEADQDGLLQDAITFSANRGASGTTSEIYIAVI
jgi:hypothetical protein